MSSYIVIRQQSIAIEILDATNIELSCHFRLREEIAWHNNYNELTVFSRNQIKMAAVAVESRLQLQYLFKDISPKFDRAESENVV